MASNVQDAFAFIWRIHNFSYSSHTRSGPLNSLPFVPNMMNMTKWTLQVYQNVEKERCICCAIIRDLNDNGPKFLTFNLEIAFLACNGYAIKWAGLKVENEHVKIGTFCLLLGTLKSEVLEKKELYLPQDVLTVQCKMWKDHDSCCREERIHVRSVLCIENVSILQTIVRFSTEAYKLKKKLRIESTVTQLFIMTVETNVLIGYDEDEKLIAEINVTEMPKENKFLCLISLLNAAGEQIQCGKTDNLYTPIENGIANLRVPLLFSKKEILDRRSEFLSNDLLLVRFEFHFTNGYIFSQMEQINCYLMSRSAETRSPQNQCDVRLKTPTKTFGVQKRILCSQSSVFKALLTDENTANSSGCIEIDGIDDEILDQLLYFLYTGHLEILQWETAYKLYQAGNKYGIEDLKTKCRTYFQGEITTMNACEILALADKHEDFLLKIHVLIFMVQHANEMAVFGTQTSLMQRNLDQVLQTALLNYRKTIN